MEFPLEIDPNIHLLPGNQQSVVQFQYANVGLPSGKFDDKLCETQAAGKMLKYDVYVRYLNENDHSEEHFLDTMEILMNVGNVTKHMKKVRYHWSCMANIVINSIILAYQMSFKLLEF